MSKVFQAELELKERIISNLSFLFQALIFFLWDRDGLLHTGTKPPLLINLPRWARRGSARAFCKKPRKMRVGFASRTHKWARPGSHRPFKKRSSKTLKWDAVKSGIPRRMNGPAQIRTGDLLDSENASVWFTWRLRQRDVMTTRPRARGSESFCPPFLCLIGMSHGLGGPDLVCYEARKYDKKLESI